MKLRITAGLAACAGIFLLLSGCMTQRVALSVVEADKPLKIERTEDLILTVRYLDDDTLKQKFGKKETNPFLSDYYSLQFRRFLVFELSLENAGSVPVKFLLNRLELQYGGKAMNAYNAFRIIQYWEFKDEEDVRGSQKAKRERFVKDNVLRDSVTIPAPGELKGYAVFTGNTPNYGTATLYVPVFTPRGEVVHRFEVSFEF